ncbi:hypothetical protein ACJMK2_016068 [Sinanodonta woodiana]|uniref:Domain of unknown function with conserved HDNR motif domain-containing protein n=1 Tax=Sinanodonta woodiana TaxID=1069815 RepID=A0ABD3USG3_SINWO
MLYSNTRNWFGYLQPRFQEIGFSSGYHGHFRNKSRNDFVNEYRQLAKPQPPKRFLQRARQPARGHAFSHHDNKQSFLNDALYFEEGLGRRRVPNSTYQFKQDFMTWMPEREFIERSRPVLSTYRIDFNGSQKQSQIFTKRPKTSFEGPPTTSYRYAHCTGAPNRELIDAMNNEVLKLSLLHRKDRAMSARSEGRESVASCLVWHCPEKKSKEASEFMQKPLIPAATQTTDYEPHPPPSRINEHQPQHTSETRAMPSVHCETQAPLTVVTHTQPPPQMQHIPSPPTRPPPTIAWGTTRPMVECAE